MNLLIWPEVLCKVYYLKFVRKQLIFTVKQVKYMQVHAVSLIMFSIWNLFLISIS